MLDLKNSRHINKSINKMLNLMGAKFDFKLLCYIIWIRGVFWLGTVWTRNPNCWDHLKAAKTHPETKVAGMRCFVKQAKTSGVKTCFCTPFWVITMVIIMCDLRAWTPTLASTLVSLRVTSRTSRLLPPASVDCIISDHIKATTALGRHASRRPEKNESQRRSVKLGCNTWWNWNYEKIN